MWILSRRPSATAPGHPPENRTLPSPRYAEEPKVMNMKTKSSTLLLGIGALLAIVSGIAIFGHYKKGSSEAASSDATSTTLPGKVYNLIILDESGSMCLVYKPTLDGANETIQTIKSNQAAHPEQRQFLTFVSFSSIGSERFRVAIDNKPIDEVKGLTEDDYRPNGGTPLWDAIGYSLTKLEASVTDEDLVLVTIITDGYENSSREYDEDSIKALVERLSEKDWAFSYIGANQDAVAVAKAIGIDNALNFSPDEKGTREMWKRESASRERYYRLRRQGASRDRLKKGYFDKE